MNSQRHARCLQKAHLHACYRLRLQTLPPPYHLEICQPCAEVRTRKGFDEHPKQRGRIQPLNWAWARAAASQVRERLVEVRHGPFRMPPAILRMQMITGPDL